MKSLKERIEESQENVKRKQLIIQELQNRLAQETLKASKLALENKSLKEMDSIRSQNQEENRDESLQKLNEELKREIREKTLALTRKEQQVQELLNEISEKENQNMELLEKLNESQVQEEIKDVLELLLKSCTKLEQACDDKLKQASNVLQKQSNRLNALRRFMIDFKQSIMEKAASQIANVTQELEKFKSECANLKTVERKLVETENESKHYQNETIKLKQRIDKVLN